MRSRLNAASGLHAETAFEAGAKEADRLERMTFLLRRPRQVRQDGFATVHTPFMVHYDGKDVYAAFESHEVATYFVRRVGLHKDYTMVSLASTEATDTKDDEHALVLKREAEVDRLLAAKMTSSDFTRNLLRLR